MKRKLLIVVNVDWFFLSHRLPLALAAREAGMEVHVATALTDSPDLIRQHGLVLHPLTLERKSTNPLRALRLTLDLWKLMRQLRPDVVHLVTIKPVMLGGLAAQLAGVPGVVAAISGLGYVFTAEGLKATLRRWVVSAMYRWVLVRPPVKVIFQNADDRDLLQRHAGVRPEQSVLVRGSGLDIQRWPMQPFPPGPPVVMMAARLLRDKGVREFVAAARLLKGHAGSRFVLVGDVDPGNPSSLSRSQVEAWVTEGVVEWWGHRQDICSAFADAHIAVLPSYREGLPKVLIEAAASGRAVVTTDVPGCRDAVLAGTTGLLVPPRDAQALANAIRQLLDAPETMRQMGRAGRLFAEKTFDIQHVVKSHLALYGASPTLPSQNASATIAQESAYRRSR